MPERGQQPGARVGETLSHYRVTASLGAGGMGEVYRATDATLGREVAIELLPTEVATIPSGSRRVLSVEHEVLDSDIWLMELR